MYTFTEADIEKINDLVQNDGFSVKRAVQRVNIDNAVSNVLGLLADALECNYLADDSMATDVRVDEDNWRITFNLNGKAFSVELNL